MVLEGYSPLKGSDLRDPVLREIAGRHGVTVAQVILRWHVEHQVRGDPEVGAQGTDRGELRFVRVPGPDEVSTEAVRQIDGRGQAIAFAPSPELLEAARVWARVREPSRSGCWRGERHRPGRPGAARRRPPTHDLRRAGRAGRHGRRAHPADRRGLGRRPAAHRRQDAQQPRRPSAAGPRRGRPARTRSPPGARATCSGSHRKTSTRAGSKTRCGWPASRPAPTRARGRAGTCGRASRCGRAPRSKTPNRSTGSPPRWPGSTSCGWPPPRTGGRSNSRRVAERWRELEYLAAAHPFRERLWELLMVALYRAGRQGDALAAYLRARDVLADQLGVEPGARLRRQHAAILAGGEPEPLLDTAGRRPSHQEPAPTDPVTLPRTAHRAGRARRRGRRGGRGGARPPAGDARRPGRLRQDPPGDRRGRRAGDPRGSSTSAWSTSRSGSPKRSRPPRSRSPTTAAPTRTTGSSVTSRRRAPAAGARQLRARQRRVRRAARPAAAGLRRTCGCSPPAANRCGCAARPCTRSRRSAPADAARLFVDLVRDHTGAAGAADEHLDLVRTSAGTSTGSRWPSSWPRPGRPRCRSRRSRPGCSDRFALLRTTREPRPARPAPPPHAGRGARLELRPHRRRPAGAAAPPVGVRRRLAARRGRGARPRTPSTC